METASLTKDFSRKILVSVIDETPKHLNDISRALTSFYTIEGFEDGQKAFDKICAAPPAVIVLDRKTGPKGGIDLLREIRDQASLKDVPVVFTSPEGDESQFDEAKCIGAGACITKPFKRSVLIDAISGMVNSTVENAWEDIEPVQRKALKETVSTFNSIADMIDEGAPLPYQGVKDSCEPLVKAVQENRFKDILKGVRGHDNYSYVHSLRVATLLSLFGHTIGIRGDDLLTLSTGGLVHDVGKMTIPYEILNKPGKLVGDDWAIMKSHVTRTMEFLENSPEMPRGALTIAGQHHEKMNGTGYPNGLKGGELNELARMASIVDVFGALTDRRVYKEPMPPEKALKLMSGMKDELDQQLLTLFHEMLLSAASGLDEDA